MQVRQPAHTRSVGRWRRFAAQLKPMYETLAAAGIEPDLSLSERCRSDLQIAICLARESDLKVAIFSRARQSRSEDRSHGSGIVLDVAMQRAL
jgi:hypothetical protein